MCKAFSCLASRDGKIYWKFTKDSHEEIFKEFNLKEKEFPGNTQDDVIAREMNFARVEVVPENGSYLNPDKWILKVDERIRPIWFNKDIEKACMNAQKEWLKELDKILIHKSIVHPFNDREAPKKITKEHIKLLKEWDSVRDSVWVSVRASVGDSVRDSVWVSVRDSVGVSVWDSVWVSVGVSVWDSVWAYTGTFFKLPRSTWKYTGKLPAKPEYPFRSAAKLWDMGLVPAFDGKKWMLFGKKDGKVQILFEIEKSKLMKMK